MALPAAASLQYLGTLIFCHHPLDLEHQVLFGSSADIVVEENDLDALPLKLLDQEHLVWIVAGETIRRVNIQAVKATSSGLVPKAFQGRTEQRAAAVALVDEAQLGVQMQATAWTRDFNASIWLAIVLASACCFEETRA
jgi:hypothetical protein